MIIMIAYANCVAVASLKRDTIFKNLVAILIQNVGKLQGMAFSLVLSAPASLPFTS